jgi:hypothetical protein
MMNILLSGYYPATLKERRGSNSSLQTTSAAEALAAITKGLGGRRVAGYSDAGDYRHRDDGIAER